VHVGESRASVPWIGLFAFGQMRRLDRLADVKPAFQCDDFGPDMTAEASALLESVIGSESGHHVLVCGNEDPEGFPWNFRPGINEGDRFHSDGSSPNSVRSAVISTRKRQTNTGPAPPDFDAFTLLPWRPKRWA
jgi:hypothetical protein